MPYGSCKKKIGYFPTFGGEGGGLRQSWKIPTFFFLNPSLRERLVMLLGKQLKVKTLNLKTQSMNRADKQKLKIKGLKIPETDPF